MKPKTKEVISEALYMVGTFVVAMCILGLIAIDWDMVLLP